MSDPNFRRGYCRM
ncbi:BgTH12-03554 [Blumeria graminis f. sp. triticale]|uniref:BgTH12-03554 n=1 Tax=Blumeria graminis f. sp. triticale TaxID=1689686 RepID=A0A9W4CVN9_BLUGR|nr:BgTH12-03554 [Blumeria graminis f. sp. triticale]